MAWAEWGKPCAASGALRPACASGCAVQILPGGRSFQVHCVVVTSEETGGWDETYSLDELGKEWRWPDPVGEA